ncbi:hypothetical protein NVP1170O_171 [Vibrio phage 1.170.O._10N.261.52.C3]|nr:hypothetical protein NVP1170O_171 [Vibrio phage 1.170.O._10N.261.52.C3]
MYNNGSCLTFESACENVRYFHEKDKKGKTRLEKANQGFTCYSNSVNLLKSYAKQKFSVPTKAKIAEDLLKEVGYV